MIVKAIRRADGGVAGWRFTMDSPKHRTSLAVCYEHAAPSEGNAACVCLVSGAEASAADSHGGFGAPLAGLAAADAIDGFLGPFRGSGGRRGGVGVAGGGVVGEQGVADAAVHLDLDHVAMGTEAVPAPVDLDMAVG